MSIRDLADFHHPVSTLFAEIKSKIDYEPFALSKEQVEHFEEYGYVTNVKIYDEEQVDILRAELDKIQAPDHPARELFYEFHGNHSTNPDTVLFHSLGHWRISEAFHDALWNPAFTKPASQLLGDKPVRFWHDQLFCKPAGHGGVVAWHQDYSYWIRTVPMQHLTCWIGLDDASTENGCLNYVPSSHRWGLLKRLELGGEMDALFEQLDEEQRAQIKPVPMELKKGHACFHHPLMVHGSYENKSERSRRAMVLNVFADGTISDTDDIMLRGTDIRVPKGQPLNTKYFPLIYPVN
ncbi:phytanoyl-CoA dioxygenase family protein [Agaribacter flavus]|uniref:Phytanoyl-CoA dioxygenase family protein n=1 Tax=Agaribacter flavus TaxID=1902781 RepID=A0ABV7FK53_9ALTE